MIVWPKSIVGEAGVMVAEIARFTVTVTWAQKLANGAPALASVTLTEKEVVEVSTGVEKDADVEPGMMLPTTQVNPVYHW